MGRNKDQKKKTEEGGEKKRRTSKYDSVQGERRKKARMERQVRKEAAKRARLVKRIEALQKILGNREYYPARVKLRDALADTLAGGPQQRSMGLLHKRMRRKARRLGLVQPPLRRKPRKASPPLAEIGRAVSRAVEEEIKE